ncbi:MAG: hypothetical protein IKJ89_08130 [Kiritimatiellae bacterium]|nr:hypothetical protein [Kiritimatiellia bacterium]
MIVRSLAALLIVFAVGCASEKALNRGCASSVRVSAVVFDKAVYNAASQAELIEKFRSHAVEPLWSHILTPGGGAISTTREARVFTGYEYVSNVRRPILMSRREVVPSDDPVADHPVKQKKYTSRNVGEWINIGESKGDVLGVECEFSFVEKSKSDNDFDIVHSGKVIGTVPIGAGDSLVGSVQADASGSQIIVIIISQ